MHIRWISSVLGGRSQPTRASVVAEVSSGRAVSNSFRLLQLCVKLARLHRKPEYAGQRFVGVSIVDRGMSRPNRDAAYAPFNTVTLDQLRQEPESPDPTTPRVLVSTAGLSAQGLNLTRASYLVILDPDWTESRHLQAINRILRDGQLHPTHQRMLVDQGNHAEVAIRDRQLRRVTLQAGIWEAAS